MTHARTAAKAEGQPIHRRPGFRLASILVAALILAGCGDPPISVVIRNEDTIAYHVSWRVDPEPEDAGKVRIEPGQTGRMTSITGPGTIRLTLGTSEPCGLADVVNVTAAAWLVPIRNGKFGTPRSESPGPVGDLPRVDDCTP
ncbi:MAG TPA: hypothetical protein VER83_08170 [Candidatus Nanopelagicales bacterium]|nr:hypothetical protein [Candidatus Nanopelagicales bacterium]